MSYAAMLCMEADVREAAMEGQAEEEAREVERLRAIYERGVARNIDGDLAAWTVEEFTNMFGDTLWKAGTSFSETPCATEERALTVAIERNDALWQHHLDRRATERMERRMSDPDGDSIPF